MKIVYMSEEFNIEEVDLYSGEIVFSTNNTMGWFDEGEKGEKTKFKIYFDSVYELQNIPLLLWNYLKENGMLY